MNEKENYQVTEQILIALAITNIEYLIEIQTNLVVEDFQNETNRKVYQTLLKMKNNDENIDYDMNFTFNKAQKREVNVALSNTFGFGGHNACVIFKKYTD